MYLQGLTLDIKASLASPQFAHVLCCCYLKRSQPSRSLLYQSCGSHLNAESTRYFFSQTFNTHDLLASSFIVTFNYLSTRIALGTSAIEPQALRKAIIINNTMSSSQESTFAAAHAKPELIGGLLRDIHPIPEAGYKNQFKYDGAARTSLTTQVRHSLNGVLERCTHLCSSELRLKITSKTSCSHNFRSS